MNISFHTVKYLNRTTFFRLFLGFLGCIRECLNHTVVCDCHRRLTPCCRLAHNIRNFV